MRKRFDLDEMSDEQILKLIASKNTFEQGFKALMATYQERLYWHVRRMVTSHEETDDVLQNTFVKVFKGISTFRGGSSLYTWLYRIATNEALNALKKMNRIKTYNGGEGDLEIMDTLASDAWFDGDQAQAMLVAAINTLPDKQKAVFNLRYHEDMSYADISEVTGTSVGALKASYHHAAKKIESYLTQRVS